VQAERRRHQFHWGAFLRLAAVALAGVAAGLLLFTLGLSHHYVTALTRPGCPDLGWRPEETGYRGVSFTTSDGVELGGWYVPGRNGAAIILLGGMGTRSGMLPEGEMLARHDYGLFLFDWRGCGASQESIHTLGYQETLDLLAAADFLIEQTGTTQIGALGFSLGGAVAIRGAAVHPGIRAVVAMGNYHDLEAEIYGSGDDHPIISAIFEREIAWLFQRETGVDFDQELEPVELVGQISPRPLLLIYGKQEEALPPASGYLLYQAAGEPKELWLLPNVGHGGYLNAAPEEFERRVVAFFDAALLR